jgi:hypothetical protein
VQLEVHPVPQFRLHVLFDEQLNVALLGTSVSEDPPSAPGPKEHVPPDWHVHVAPLQEHEPLHARGDGEAPEHEANGKTRVASNHRRLSMPEAYAASVPR